MRGSADDDYLCFQFDIPGPFRRCGVEVTFPKTEGGNLRRMGWQRARKPGLVGKFGFFPINNVQGLFQVRKLLALKRLCQGVSVRYACKQSGPALISTPMTFNTGKRRHLMPDYINMIDLELTYKIACM